MQKCIRCVRSRLPATNGYGAVQQCAVAVPAVLANTVVIQGYCGQVVQFGSIEYVLLISLSWLRYSEVMLCLSPCCTTQEAWTVADMFGICVC